LVALWAVHLAAHLAAHLTAHLAAQSCGSTWLCLALLDSWIGLVVVGLFIDEIFVFFIHSLTHFFTDGVAVFLLFNVVVACL